MDQLRTEEEKEDKGHVLWLKKFWRRIRNQARYSMSKAKRNQQNAAEDDRQLQEHEPEDDSLVPAQDGIEEVLSETEGSGEVENGVEALQDDGPEQHCLPDVREFCEGRESSSSGLDKNKAMADVEELNLMQRCENWVQFVQDDLDALRRSGVRVGGHAQQLRAYCQEIGAECKDKEATDDIDALLAVYCDDEAEEARSDLVDQWAAEWREKVIPLLCTDPAIEVDMPSETALRRMQLIDKMRATAMQKKEAGKARRQEENDLCEAMEASLKFKKPNVVGPSSSTGTTATAAAAGGDGTGEGDGIEGPEGGVSSVGSTEIVTVETVMHLSPGLVQVSGVQIVQSHANGYGNQHQVLSLRVSVRIPTAASVDVATQTGD